MLQIDTSSSALSFSIVSTAAPHVSYLQANQSWQVFSTFKGLPETPPEVTTASLGAPIEIDVEKGIESGGSEDRKL